MLVCPCWFNIVYGLTLSDHLEDVTYEQDEENELTHFLLVICFCFWKIHGKFLGLSSFEQLKEMVTIYCPIQA